MVPSFGPNRNAQTSDVDEEADLVLDDIIAQIDETLPTIIRKAKVNGSQKLSSRRLSREQFERAKAEFEAMRDDPLLTDAGDDICLNSRKKSRKRPVSRKVASPHKNGKHP